MDGFNHQKLLQIADACSTWGLDLELPMFVLAGTQSAGKTLMLEFITKLKLGFSAIGMATKCPVEYRLTHTNGETKYKVNGLDQTTDGRVSVAVKNHMDQIGDRVIPDVLIVEISSPLVPNMIIIDLPGLNFASHENIDMITTLLQSYTKNPLAYVIAIIQAEASIGQSASFNHMRNLLLETSTIEEKRCILLVNQIDTQFENWTGYGVQALTQHLFHEWEDDFPTYFITLNPKGIPKVDLDTMNAKQKKTYLMNLAPEERRIVQEKVGKLVDERFLKERFFLDNVLDILEKKFSDFFNRNKPRILEQIKEAKRAIYDKCSTMQQTLHNTNDEQLNNIFDLTITRYIELLFGIMNSNPVSPSHSGIISTESARPQDTFFELASTFLDDVELVGEDFEKYPFLMSVEQLKDLRSKQLAIAPRSLLSRMESKSTGKATFNRAKQFLEFMLLLLGMETYSRDQIDDIAANNGAMNSFDVAAVVQYMITNQLARASQGIEWWTTLVRTRLVQYQNWVSAELLKQQAVDNPMMPNFIDRISDLFTKWFDDEILAPMERRWKESTNLFCNHCPADICVKTLLYVAVGPCEDIIYSKDMVKRASGVPIRRAIPNNGEHNEENIILDEDECRDKLKLIVENVIRNLSDLLDEGEDENHSTIEALEQIEKETKVQIEEDKKRLIRACLLANTPQDIVDYLLPFYLEQLKEVKIEQGEQEEDLTHHEKMIDWIEEIRKSFRENGKGISHIDAVQGGYQTVKQAPIQLVNHGYIRSVAYENYLMVLCRFLFDFDASYANYFHSTIDSRRMSSPINYVQGRIFNDDENEREDMIKAHREKLKQLEEEYENALNEKRDIDKLFASLQ